MGNHERLEQGGPIKFTYQARHHCGWEGEEHEALPQPGKETPSPEDAWVARIEAAYEFLDHIRDCQEASPWERYRGERYRDLATALTLPNIRVKRESL